MELKKREDILETDKWKLDKVYKSLEDFEKEFTEVKEKGEILKLYVGKLGDAKTLIEYLKLDEEVSRKAEKLYVYAHMKSDEDTSNNKNQGVKNKVDGYMAELSSYGAFFVPEILELGEETIFKMIEENEELKVYTFMFKDILKGKEHTLSKEIEEVLAGVSDCLNAPDNIQGILTNADMTFDIIKNEKGEEVRLTEGNYSSFIKSKDREVRKEAFKALFKEYKKLQNTLGTTLTSSLKNFNFVARKRNYKSSIEAALKPNNIPVKVYEEAIETVNKHLSSLHRYVSLKKRLLGLEDMHMYDLYVPVIEMEKEHIEFNDGVDTILSALEVLGEEYIDIFKDGINKGWIDKYENKGKRGGAYSWGSYDTMPYVLLNYNYDLNDVSTLAHEMGHSIHSYYSNKNQPYTYAGYTIFCAEIASTTNESLLINYLINNEKDKNKRLYLINQELEQIRTTVFRQLMFAEFEYYTHKMIDEGHPLTTEEYSKKWHELNVNYFGADMVVDEEIDIEWARIPHFYSDFYVYQYATGYAAASAFSSSILNKEEDAVLKYKNFLKSGGSDYPIEILKKSGVDMTTSEPLLKTIERFNKLLDMLEKEI